MKYVFGPVPSRRLGQSLGIDTIPLKTCNWNCVYCQLGRTVPLINERREYFPRGDILAEIEKALKDRQSGDIDWVTFVGSGEPTLHAGLGWLIHQTQKLTDLPVAVITNGSLLYLPEVRRGLATADAVMPTVDAGSADLYRRLNRPHPEISYTRLVDGLMDFRCEYYGKLWIEVMLVQGLNDTEEALREIADILLSIQPDEIHINLPTRPPAETWVQPPNEEALTRAVALLGNIAKVIHPAAGSFDLNRCDSVVDAVINIITRHPMSQETLERTLAQWGPGQVNEVLNQLEVNGQAQVVERHGTRFWCASHSRYPDEAHSLATAPDRATRDV